MGVAAWISSSLQGQSGKKAAGTGTTPQLTPANQASQLAEAGDSRFASAGVQTYQPVKGDAYFALQIQPKLDPAPARPRDYLIMLSTAATQAGPDWIAGASDRRRHHRDGQSDSDRVCLWTVNEPKTTKNLTKDFLLAKDKAEGTRLRERPQEIPQQRNSRSGDTDLKNALAEAIRSFDDPTGIANGSSSSSATASAPTTQ